MADTDTFDREATIPSYAVEIRVTPREGILDPEGQTIGSALANLGYDGVSEVRSGRLVHLRLDAGGEEEARTSAREMCEELIANPVIEDYEVRVTPAQDRTEAGRGAGGDAA